MAKHQQTTITSGAAGAGAAAAMSAEPVEEAGMTDNPMTETDVSVSAPSHEHIARVAFSCWQARGCPDGSPEEDWFRAEAELSKRAGT
jgi:hypothetical protein